MQTKIRRTKKVLFHKSTMLAVNAQTVKLIANQTFDSVHDVASAFGAKVLPRRGFGYIGKNGSQSYIAVWCVNLGNNPYWYNQLVDNDNTLLEQKKRGESREAFLQRIRKDLDYDTEQLRLTFSKVKGRLKFIGIFQLSGFDIDKQTTIFKRVENQPLVISYRQMTKTMKITIEETEELTETAFII